MVKNENRNLEVELSSLIERTMKLEYELDLIRSNRE